MVEDASRSALVLRVAGGVHDHARVVGLALIVGDLDGGRDAVG